MPPKIHQSDEPVSFDTCRLIRGECKSVWWKVVGGLVAAFVSIAGILYAAQTKQSEDLSDMGRKVAAQEVLVQRMGDDIKEIRRGNDAMLDVMGVKRR